MSARAFSTLDVGEQTGALPEMLLKIADNFDEEVDNAVAGELTCTNGQRVVFKGRRNTGRRKELLKHGKSICRYGGQVITREQHST